MVLPSYGKTLKFNSAYMTRIGSGKQRYSSWYLSCSIYESRVQASKQAEDREYSWLFQCRYAPNQWDLLKDRSRQAWSKLFRFEPGEFEIMASRQLSLELSHFRDKYGKTILIII